MLELNRHKNNKWIFQKNISSNLLMEAYLDALAQQENIIDPEQIRSTLQRNNAYRGRSETGSSNTMGVRLSQMCFYMTGYKKDDKFLLSTTTQMIRKKDKNIDTAEASLINLFSMQYPCPYSNTPENFRIYIGRFILKLLLDERLSKRLYIDEFIWFLPFIEKIDEETYEKLILEILKYRNLTYEQKQKMYEAIEDYEELFANCTHEINYYFLQIFSGFRVFELKQDAIYNGGKVFSFQHGRGPTYRKTGVGSGKSVPGYVELSSCLVEKAKILLDKYSVFDEPETQATALSKEDWIRNLYEFNMLDYIDAINLDRKYDEEVILAVKDMVYQSKYGSNDGKSFEQSLKPVFELFRENISTEIISGSGDTDLLCVMRDNDLCYKVNVDAKKTRNRLEGIRTTRILNHIRRNGSKYCIIVSPRFSRGAITDIKDCEIVTIEAETLANYCLKECLNSSDGCADYETLNELIINNKGKDITKLVDNLIIERYQIA